MSDTNELATIEKMRRVASIDRLYEKLQDFISVAPYKINIVYLIPKIGAYADVRPSEFSTRNKKVIEAFVQAAKNVMAEYDKELSDIFKETKPNENHNITNQQCADGTVKE